MARTLILGAGFGGLTVAFELRRLLGDEQEIVLVDRKEQFSMGLRKLWELVGHATIAEGSRARADVGHGIRFVLGEIEAIDPSARAATVGGEQLDGDHLVVALGAQPRPDLVAGLVEHGHDVWDVANVPGARDALGALDGGRIAIVIAGAPYTCPPAPYECAMLVEEQLRERGIREQTSIQVSTVLPLLLPAAGKAGSDFIAEQLTSRGIEHRTGCQLEHFDQGKTIFADGEEDFDLLIGVPPHRAPEVVVKSGLTGESGWIHVDPGTLETGHPGVFAVGDVTHIPLANKLPLPKAGVIAELEGKRVAAAIAADLGGESAPPPFDGHGFCFLEMGSSAAAYVEGDFYAEPEPSVSITDPTPASAQAKREFEAERLARWFGG